MAKLYHVAREKTAERRCVLLREAFPEHDFKPVPSWVYGWNIRQENRATGRRAFVAQGKIGGKRRRLNLVEG